MLPSLVIVAALWDLILWIPVLLIIAVVSAVTIVCHCLHSSRWDDDYKDKP
ncbi:MAG: hypothetical protein JNL18_01100 [Planctomycetaceae bacterium]|nr:hypothetical protein [Planctomycetaceae bacterium]